MGADALIFGNLDLELVELLLESHLQLTVRDGGVLDHRLTPVLVDHGRVLLEVKLLNHLQGELVVTVLEQELEDVLCLEFLKLLVSHGSSALL